jgi:hypothetical protein
MDHFIYFIPISISIGFFAMVAFIIWAKANARQQTARLQADVQTKLIEKFGSATEFIQFLQSPAGRQFLEGTPRALTRHRIAWGISSGIVVSCLGLAFIFLALRSDPDFIIPGIILLALGIGFFVAAAVSLKLSRRWDQPGVPEQPNVSAYRS